MTQRRGGMCVFFEYNPTDELHYLCFNANGTLYLKTINATTAVEAISDSQSINVGEGMVSVLVMRLTVLQT